MRRIVVFSASLRRACGGFWPALLLALCACCATAQDLPAGSPSQAPQEENPLLLLAPEQTPAARATATDYSRLLFVTLSDTFKQRFTVVEYDDKQPRIRRALTEHEVSAADVTSPQSAEAVERVATTLGARYVFRYTLKTAPDSVTVDIQFLKRVDQKDWVVALGDTIQTQTMAGKRRLKASDIVAVVVDGIAQRLTIPSHLAANRNQAAMQTALKEAGKKDSGQKSKPDKTKAEPVPAPGSSTEGTKTAETPPPPTGDQAAAADTGTNTGAAAATTSAAGTATRQTGISGGQRQRGKAVPPADEPAAPPAPRPEPVADPAVEAARFRDTGDLANAIVCMRHAIDAHPSDMALRRDLVLDYQQKHMYDAAASEAERALRIDSSDARLLREYGDLLVVEGKPADALKYYRLATEKDPKDVVAQVALGDALLAGGHADEAIEAYKAAGQKDAHSLVPHLRLARTYAARAATDTSQYDLSIQELTQARSMMSATDNDVYRKDYVELMRLMDARLRSLSDEAVTTNQAQLSGRTSMADARRNGEQLALRVQAASDFLDKVTPAAGLDRIHLQYQEAAALTLQATQQFRDYLARGEALQKDEWDSTRLNATRTLNAAARALGAFQTPQGTAQ